MIIYLTGVPGHGKSLRAMWYLAKPEFQGRRIFSNIKGPDWTKEKPTWPDGHEPIPDRWMDVPDGSVIAIDECQHRWPQRGPSTKTPDEEAALDEHRHRGIDFVLMTQRPTGVSHHVRGLVGRHEHLRRKGGLQKSVIFRKEEAFNPKDNWELKTTDTEIWSYPKELYGSYKSSVEHTQLYKFKMPAKAKLYLGATAIGTLIAGYLLYTAAAVFTGPLEAKEEPKKYEQTPEIKKEFESWGYEETAEYNPNDEVGICYATNERCSCFKNNGRKAHTWTTAQCLNWIVEQGGQIPSQPKLAAREGSGEAAPAAAVRVSDTAHLSQY